jgi:hypothetical protein
MPRFNRPVTAFLVAVCVGACATSGTRPAPATPETVHAAQLAQQEVIITRDLRQQRRVDDVGHKLLAVATPYCTGAVASATGVRFANVNSFPSTYEDAARAVGFSDTVLIVSVARGSAAARAGIEVGDRVVGVNDGTAPRGPNAASQLARAIAVRGPAAPRLTLHHGDTTFLMDAPARSQARAYSGGSSDTHVTVPADTVCGYNLIASRKDETNAWADGSNVTVTSAMLRFVVDNDELAAVLAHEIAHTALGHVQAQQQTTIDGSFGAIVDTSAAVRAMNARGETGKQPLDVGSLVFSQVQERDADDVAMYLLARVGRPVGEVTNLWRHVAQHNPSNVKYVGMHPTTKARLARLERAERDMPAKFARGERPTPAVTGPNVVGATESLAMYELSAGDSVSYTFGPPVPRDGLTLAEVRRRALQAYQDGNEALELRLYAQAEARYREAVLYDGSEARYHAALGATLLKRGKRAEAEAVLSAAVLLDVDNAEYRRLLVAARQRER